jgi:redox-sensitive bicupin YhaK (pirin superfamily)
MTIVLHPALERGKTEVDWLQSRHSFSFNEYYNPARMGFGGLMVLNDDVIAPGKGFGMHPHKDMEIITVMLSGTLEHRDSTGGHGILRAGEVQYMSAGTGIVHSEVNASKTESAKLLQLWITPSERGLRPTYMQRSFTIARNAMTPLITVDGRDASLIIRRDAAILRCALPTGNSIAYQPEHSAFVFIIAGAAEVSGRAVGERDALAVTEEESIDIKATQDCDLLIIDVPQEE